MATFFRFLSQSWQAQPPSFLDQTLPGYGGRSQALSLQEFLGKDASAWAESWGWRVAHRQPLQHAFVSRESAGPHQERVIVRLEDGADPGFVEQVRQWCAQHATDPNWESINA